MRSPEVCRAAGVTYRQLDYWHRTGVLRPSVQNANGQGTRREYSDADVTVATVLGRLSRIGVLPTSALARSIVVALRLGATRACISDGITLVLDLDELALIRARAS